MYDFSSSSYSKVQPMMSLILLQMLHLEKKRMKERERGREKEWERKKEMCSTDLCIINKSSTSFETSGLAGQCRTGRGVLCFVWWSVEVVPFTCSCSVTAPLEKQITLCVCVCVRAQPWQWRELLWQETMWRRRVIKLLAGPWPTLPKCCCPARNSSAMRLTFFCVCLSACVCICVPGTTIVSLQYCSG